MSDHEPQTDESPDMSRSAFGQLAAENFDFLASMGGLRGLLESTVPGLVFVVVFVATRDLLPALIAASALALLAFIVRLLARQSVQMAVSGLLGVAIGVVWAWRSGEASNYFLWGLLTNAVYGTVLLISVLVKWPLVGVIMAALRGRWDTWRSSPLYSRYVLATWLWVGLFGARLAVQVPLYLDQSVGWLGTARLIMGVPFFSLALWLTWLLVREPATLELPEETTPQ